MTSGSLTRRIKYIAVALALLCIFMYIMDSMAIEVYVIFALFLQRDNRQRLSMDLQAHKPCAIWKSHHRTPLVHKKSSQADKSATAHALPKCKPVASTSNKLAEERYLGPGPLAADARFPASVEHKIQAIWTDPEPYTKCPSPASHHVSSKKLEKPRTPPHARSWSGPLSVRHGAAGAVYPAAEPLSWGMASSSNG